MATPSCNEPEVRVQLERVSGAGATGLTGPLAEPVDDREDVGRTQSSVCRRLRRVGRDRRSPGGRTRRDPHSESHKAPNKDKWQQRGEQDRSRHDQVPQEVGARLKRQLGAHDLRDEAPALERPWNQRERCRHQRPTPMTACWLTDVVGQ